MTGPAITLFPEDEGPKPQQPTTLFPEPGERMRQSLRLGADTSPDEAARVIRLSRETGLSPAVVGRNLPEIEKGRKLDVGNIELRERAPVTADWVAEHPNHAAVAADDLGNLSAVEGLLKSLKSGAKIGRAQSKQGRLGFEALTRGGNLTEPERKRIEALEREISREPTGRNFLTNVLFQGAKIYGQMSDAVPEVAEGGAIGAAAGASVGAVGVVTGPGVALTVGAGATGGFLVGAGARLANYTFQIEAGAAYLEMQKIRGDDGQGLDPKVTTAAAVGVGVLNAGLEMIGLKLIAAPFRMAARKFTADVARDMLVRPTMRSAMAEFGKSYATAIAGETGTEVLQEMTSIAAEELSKMASNGQFATIMRDPEQRELAVQRLVDIASQTASGMLLVGFPGASVNLAADVVTARRASQRETFYLALGEGVKGSKTFERLPEALQDLVERATKDGPIENVFIDVEPFQQYFQSQNADPREVARELWGSTDEYDQALQTGAALSIPMSRYATRLAPTDHAAFFAKELRQTPDGMNAREAAAFIKEAEARAKEEPAQAEGPDAREALTKTIATQIEETGRFRGPDATTLATQMASFFTTQGERYGIDPTQLFNRYGLQVLRGEDRSQPTQAGVPRPDEAAMERTAIEGEEGEMAGATSLRTASGRLPTKLTDATPQQLADELFRLVMANADDTNLQMPTVNQDEGGHSSSLFRPYIGYKGAAVFAFGRVAARNKSIERVEAEMRARGLDPAQAFSKTAMGEALSSEVDFEFGSNVGGEFQQAAIDPLRAERAAIVAKYSDTGNLLAAREKMTPEDREAERVLSEQIAELSVPTQPAREGPRLAVLHNLSAENLVYADELGGMPVPSLGVVPAGQAFEGMGEITLIGKPHLGDPSQVPIHDADVYSPTFPRPEYPKAKQKDAQQLLNEFKPWTAKFDDDHLASEIWDNAVNRPKPQDTISRMVQSNAAQAKFLSDVKGVQVEPSLRPASQDSAPFVDMPAFRKFEAEIGYQTNYSYDDTDYRTKFTAAVREAIKEFAAQHSAHIGAADDRQVVQEILEKSLIEQWIGDAETEQAFVHFGYGMRIERSIAARNRMDVDYSATRDVVAAAMKGSEAEFKDWVDEKVLGIHGEPFLKLGRKKVPFTLPNIVEAMSGKITAQQETLTFGEGMARAATAKQFTELETMRNYAETQIAAPDKIEEARDVAKKLMSEYRDAALEFYTNTDWRGHVDTWHGLDDSMRALVKGRTAESLGRALSALGFKGVPKPVIELGVKARKAMIYAPVPYFEAKPQRAVMLEEFAGAVVPERVATPEILGILEKHGIRVKTYDSSVGDGEAVRGEAVAQFQNELEESGVRVLFQGQRVRTAEELAVRARYDASRAKYDEIVKEIFAFPVERRLALLAALRAPKDILDLNQSAFHGSPHIFTQFSLQRLGTGEGAQAYGWGLYFAGRREIADYYRRTLSERKGIQLNALSETENDAIPVWLRKAIVNEARGETKHARRYTIERIEEAIADWEKRMEDERFRLTYTNLEQPWLSEERIQGFERTLTVLRKLLATDDLTFTEPGRTYKVEIPESETMLDWDNRLSQQSPFVKAKIGDSIIYKHPTLDGLSPGIYFEHHGIATSGTMIWRGALVSELANTGSIAAATDRLMRYTGYTEAQLQERDKLLAVVKDATLGFEEEKIDSEGMDFYRSLGNPQEASQKLAALGITGIRYRDNTSRGIRSKVFLVDQQGDKWHVIWETGPGTWSGISPFFDTEAEAEAFRKKAKKREDDDTTFNYVVFDDKLVDVQEFYQSAYHGSPHVFDQFSLTAMGTGEGAQAYGWGLYFAGKKEIAEFYRKQLSGVNEPLFDALEDGGRGIPRWVRNLILRAGEPALDARMLDLKRILVDTQEDIDGVDVGLAELENLEDKPGTDDKAALRLQLLIDHDTFSERQTFDRVELALLERLKASGNYKASMPGRLYKVEIPEDDTMLDWNLPLTEQSEFVKDALEKADIQIGTLKYPTRKQAMNLLYSRHSDDLMREDIGLARTISEGRKLVEMWDGGDINEDRAQADFEKWFAEHGKLVSPTRHSTRLGMDAYQLLAQSEAIEFHTKYEVGEEVPRFDSRELASRRLAAAGITGIKFLDNSSRGNPMLVKYDPAYRLAANSFAQSNVPIEEARAGMRSAYKDATQADLDAALNDAYRIEPPKTYNYSIFDDRLIKIIDYEQKNRGRIRITQNRQISIDLLENADFSTFLHESGHAYLEILTDLGAQYETAAEDMATIRQWLGAKPGLPFTREQHEQFARGLEAYLMEGIAPSIALRRAFFRFKAWLKALYTTIRSLEVELTPDVRNVFDRMFASDMEIEAAESEAGIVPIFTTAESAGMTETEFEAYRQVVEDAHIQATDRLRTKLIEESVREQKAWWRDEREETRAEVEAEINNEPVYRALAVLQRGDLPDGTSIEEPFKLSKAGIVALRGAEFAKTLPKPYVYSRTGGIDPDQAAELLGFASGDELLQALAEAPNREQVIEGETDRRMKQRYGDMLIDGSIAEIAEESVLGEYREKVIRAELAALRKKAREVKPFVKASQPLTLTVLAAHPYPTSGAPRTPSEDRIRNISYGLKDATPDAIEAAAVDMAPMVPAGAVLVPVPNSQGDTRANRLLAEAIAAKAGATVADILEREPGESSLTRRHRGESGLTDAEIRTLPKQGVEVPSGPIVLIDNIAVSGATARSAQKAIGRDAIVLTFAEDQKAGAKERARQTKVEREGRQILAGVPDAEFVREVARNRLASIRVRDIRPFLYWVAARKANRVALDLTAKGDYAGAADAQQAHLMNVALYREATRIKEEVSTIVDFARKLEKPSIRAKIGKAGHGYLDQIDKILERFDFAPSTNRANDRRASLAAFIKDMEVQNIPVSIPEDIQNEAFRKPWAEMSYTDLVGVHDTLRHLHYLSLRWNRLLKSIEDRTLAQAVELGVASIEAHASKTLQRQLETRLPADQGLRKIQAFIGSLRKFGSVVREMDGVEDNGVLWNLLVRPLNGAADAHTLLQKDMAVKLDELFSVYTKRERLEMARKLEFNSEVQRSMTKMGKLMMALNWGTEDNRAKLQAGMEITLGHTVSQTEIEQILSTLDQRDWDFVQGVWRTIGSYWPQFKTLVERMDGIAPEKIEGVPVATKYGEIQGQYFPLKYDDRQSKEVNRNVIAQRVSQVVAGAAARASTKAGARHERVAGVRLPLRLDFGVIFEHMGEIAMDLTHTETLLDVNRILGHADMEAAVQDHYGDLVYKQMLDSVKDIAVGDVPAQNAFEQALNWTRVGATIAGLGWNLMTSFLQPLGLTQSMVRIGPKWVGRGISRWIRDAVHMENTAKWIQTKSEMMRTRTDTQNREIGEIRNKLGLARGRAGIYLDMGISKVTVEKLDLQDVEDSFFWLITRMQLVADIPTWLGAYEKALAADPADEATAIALADQAVIDSQGSGQIKDLADIQKGSPALKLFTNFYSFFSTTYNLHVESIRRTNFRKPASVGRLAVDLLLLSVVPVILGHFLRQAVKGGDDDDGLAVALAREEIAYLVGMVPGLREIGGVVQGFHGYEGPAGSRMFSEMGKLIAQVQQGDSDRALWRALNNSAGILLHYPAGQVQRTIEGYMAWSENRANIGALLFGPPRK